MAEDKIARSNDGGADGDQPTAAVTIDDRPYKRCDTGADDRLSGPQQGKDAARDAEIDSERFKEDAESAGEGE